MPVPPRPRITGAPPRRCFLAAAALLALGACSRNEAPAPGATTPAGTDAAPDASSARSAFDRAAQGHGLVVGQALAARVLLVFFDPQCPHCAALWTAVQPLRDQVRMVWMPVAFVAPPSAAQGALLLGAADPARAMDAHEAALAQGKGGLEVDAASVDDALLAKVQANTALWSAVGGTSVPYLLWRAGSEGPYGAHAGALTTDALARQLGL